MEVAACILEKFWNPAIEYDVEEETAALPALPTSAKSETSAEQ